MSDPVAAATTAYVLKVRSPDGREVLYPLREESLTIGRAGINSVVLKDSLASRFHARIEWEKGRYLLMDRGSKNGILVGGTPVQSHLLSPGDEILVGDTALLFDVATEIADGTDTGEALSWTPRNGEMPEELDGVARQLAAADDLDALEAMAVHLRSVIACDRSAVVLFDARGKVLKRFCRSAVPGGSSDGPDEGVLKAGWNAERPVAMSLVRDTSELEATLDVSRHVLLVPICIDDVKVGLIALEREPWRPPFAPDELRLAAAAGVQARVFLRRFA